MNDITAQRRRPLRELAQHARAGLALAAGRRQEVACWQATLGHALVALALLWLTVAALQWLAVGAGARFWLWGIAAESVRQYCWLLSLALAAWVCRRGSGFLLLVTALAWAAIPMLLVSQGLLLFAPRLVEFTPEQLEWLGYGIVAWHCAVLWRALDLIGSLAPLRVGIALALHGAAVQFALTVLPDSAMFYREEVAPPALDVEAIYYRQPALLEAALAELAAHDPAKVDAYFLAVGAWAEQDVFRREVAGAQRIVGARLGLDARHSLALVNHPLTVDEVPLANRHNLATAIAGITARMDPAQDILIVFLTSHGWEDASIAVDFAGFGMQDIYAEDLRAMLDAAGVTWRVVIVSACYSGSFVAPLAGPTTLVMTAAAANRSSFGCSTENSWTYFGEAFFVDALSRTQDLIEAFELAAARIAAREAEEDKEPSQPQIAVGSRIAAQLRAWRADAGTQPSVSR